MKATIQESKNRIQKLEKINQEMKEELFLDTHWQKLFRWSFSLFIMFSIFLVIWYWKGEYILHPIASLTGFVLSGLMAIIATFYKKDWKRIMEANHENQV